MQDFQGPLVPGTTISSGSRDSYVIEGLLGKGGFSAIYLVRDQRGQHNIYALKEVIHPAKQEKEGFLFECEVLMRLSHPALPRVYRVFEDREHQRAYVLMDYINGPNLKQLQQPEKPLPLNRVIALMAPIASAVDFLHRQNPPILHRDIKPANIIVPATGEGAVLVDFGISKEYEPEATTTAVRHCSPGYSAPEQYGVGTTPRTDIYGLGATIYTLLTGIIPIDALQRMILLNEKGIDPLEPVQQLVPTLPPHVAEAIQRTLDPNSNVRFASVEEFWQAFSGSGTTHSLMGSLSAPSSRSPGPAAASVAALTRPAIVMPPTKPRFPRFSKASISAAICLTTLLIAGLSIVMALKPAPSHTQPLSSSNVMPMPRITPPSTSGGMLYPRLVQHYDGTISDLATGTTTKMTLSSLQQTGGHLHGIFSGLGLTVPLIGTVDTAEHLQFQAAIYAGRETIVFEGLIKIGGILAGSYKILSQSQGFTGEYGLWSVSPP